jgi:hypothetical protein
MWNGESERHRLSAYGIHTKKDMKLINIKTNNVQEELNYWINYFRNNKKINLKEDTGIYSNELAFRDTWNEWKTNFQWTLSKDHLQYTIGRYYGLSLDQIKSALGKEGKEYYEDMSESEIDAWIKDSGSMNFYKEDKTFLRKLAYVKIRTEKALKKLSDSNGNVILYRGLTGREARYLDKQNVKSKVITAFSLSKKEAKKFNEKILVLKVPIKYIWYADIASPYEEQNIYAENEVVVALPKRYFIKTNNTWEIKK